ncbi:MAG: helix-turn-helix transcriptional regulator [Chloroflexota bacterium]
MPGFERSLERASRQAAAALTRAGNELREARLGRGLSLRTVANAVGISPSEASRIERGHSPRVPFQALARYAAAVGLDVPLRMFPGPRPIRDAAHIALLDDFRRRLHRSLRWAVEVPLPNPGDQRAWDGMIIGPDWRYGVEAEIVVSDAQATLRRLMLKARDGGVDGVILVVRGTRRTMDAVRAARPELTAGLPIPGRRAIELLAAGVDPGGSALVVLPPRPRRVPVLPGGRSRQPEQPAMAHVAMVSRWAARPDRWGLRLPWDGTQRRAA